MKNFRLLSLATIIYTLAACSSSRHTPQSGAPGFGQLKLIGQQIIPHNFPFEGTVTGGLSGIDYDAAHQQYYLICDDRSALQPARFYTARLYFTPASFDSMRFTGVTYLRQANGNTYPGNKENAALTPDPEAMRLNPRNGTLVWSSEGERIVNEKDTILTHPSITSISRDGHYIDTFVLPEQFRMHADARGPRRNGVFEGLGFTADGRYLYVSLEEPRYEDGPRAALQPNGAYTRLIKFDAGSRKPVAQYAYELAPIAHPPQPANAFSVNGIADILVLSDHQLLTLERSFSSGVKGCVIRLYLTDLRQATDISHTNALKGQKNFTPAKKTLLYDFTTLNSYIDNIEGVTFGPVLPNGHRSLVFAADNNFSDKEETQFFVFEIL